MTIDTTVRASVQHPGVAGCVIRDAVQTNSTRAQRRLAVHVLAEHADELPGPVLYDLLDRIIGPRPLASFNLVHAALTDLYRTQKETADWRDWHAIVSAIEGREKVLNLALNSAVAA